MFARGAVLGAEHEGLAVPRSALLPGDGGNATDVLVVNPDGTVTRRRLVLGADVGERIEVQSGLNPGDRVVTVGGYSLPDGTKVEIVQ
jgi:multidrug efflux system membrane fusion protein